MEFLTSHHLLGLVIGLATFLVIGIFHPIVIKAEYHLGTKCWWVVDNVLAASIMGVTAFSCFWSILEVFHQQERVRKGWFPRNPKRRYPWDNDNNQNN